MVNSVVFLENYCESISTGSKLDKKSQLFTKNSYNLKKNIDRILMA